VRPLPNPMISPSDLLKGPPCTFVVPSLCFKPCPPSSSSSPIHPDFFLPPPLGGNLSRIFSLLKAVYWFLSFVPPRSPFFPISADHTPPVGGCSGLALFHSYPHEIYFAQRLLSSEIYLFSPPPGDCLLFCARTTPPPRDLPTSSPASHLFYPMARTTPLV